MPVSLVAYILTAVIFFGMDFIWLSVAGNLLYRPRLGSLMLAQPNMAVAGVFYLIYVLGIVVFAVMPALESGSWPRALMSGALLGLVAYGTYDMTNLATLNGWSATVSLADWLWGTLATATSAALAVKLIPYATRVLHF